MNHSLRTADLETHIRIVAISLIAGMFVVVGALSARFDSHGGAIRSAAHPYVIKASRQAVYSVNEKPLVR
jgi:hypothetical protein